MNILDFYKVNNFLNKYFGFSFSALKKVVAKCLKLIWNHSGIISGAYFSPFQGVYYLYRGLRRAPKPYFGHILEFWIIFLIFLEKVELDWLCVWLCLSSLRSLSLLVAEVSENSRSREFSTRVSFIFSRSTTRNDFLKSRSRLETWE